jgi:pimeloyl-ACP methyl ester carboxylesterase
MATFVIVHGAGGCGWEWHLVAAELRAKGHRVAAPDLPSEDETAGFARTTETVADAAAEAIAADPGGRVVVVGHSLGGFVAPLVAERLGAGLLVLAAGMIPAPGERAGDWWDHVGYRAAQRERNEREGRPVDAPFDELDLFWADLPPELVAEAKRHGRGQSEISMTEPWPLDAWPDVPTRFVVFRDDRFFPPELLHRVAEERLGVTADEVPGGHCAYLSRPVELAERLDSYLT